MAISTSYFASDLNAVIDDLPATFILGALTFNCSVTMLDQAQTLLLAGLDAHEAISVVVPASAVSASVTALVPNLRVMVRMPGDAANSNYAVVTVQQSQDNVSYNLICKEDTRLPA